MVQNLIDTVKWVFFVDKRVEKYAKRPDVLLLAAVGFALQNFGGCVVCCVAEVSRGYGR